MSLLLEAEAGQIAQIVPLFAFSLIFGANHLTVKHLGDDVTTVTMPYEAFLHPLFFALGRLQPKPRVPLRVFLVSVSP